MHAGSASLLPTYNARKGAKGSTRRTRSTWAQARRRGVQIAERDVQNFLVKEQEGGKGLVLSRGGDLGMHSEVGEEGFDL